MQYLREPDEESTFQIIQDSDDEFGDDDQPMHPEFGFRQPEVDNQDEPIDGLDMNSDAEVDFDDSCELEDNFIELVGGPPVKDTDEVVGPAAAVDDAPKLEDILPKDKVRLMRRFLYGDEDHSDTESG